MARRAELFGLVIRTFRSAPALTCLDVPVPARAVTSLTSLRLFSSPSHEELRTQLIVEGGRVVSVGPQPAQSSSFDQNTEQPRANEARLRVRLMEASMKHVVLFLKLYAPVIILTL